MRLYILTFYMFMIFAALQLANVWGSEKSPSNSLERYELKNQTVSAVQNFIEAIKTDDPKIIADFVSFPFNLEPPLPNINDKQEFIEKYKLLFDANIKRLITGSHTQDWIQMGDKGIMFLSGLIWLDNNGKLVALHLTTPRQKQLANEIKKMDLQTLNPTVKEFKRNLYQFKTSKGAGRIDETDSDKHTSGGYRFAFWNKDKDFSQKPDLVLNGSKIFDGNGGNHYYEFKKEDYTYLFYVTYVGSDTTPPYELRIYKGDIWQKDNLKASFIPTLLNK